MMRITVMGSIVCNILSWSMWVIISDFCTNSDFWTDSLCTNSINMYKCKFTRNIGGSVIFMLVVLTLQIITAIIIFIKVKPNKKVQQMYKRMQLGRPPQQSRFTSGGYDPTKTGTTTLQLTTTGSYHARDIAVSGATLTKTDPSLPQYIIKSSINTTMNE